MTYEDFKTLAPYDKLNVLLTEYSLEGVDRGVNERLERRRRNVVQSGDNGILELECAVFFRCRSILSNIEDVSMTGWAT